MLQSKELQYHHTPPPPPPPKEIGTQDSKYPTTTYLELFHMWKVRVGCTQNLPLPLLGIEVVPARSSIQKEKKILKHDY